MPGKDFEKQVQEKMDELSFAPSDAVWQKVEHEIAPAKRRRIPVWFFLLAALLAGGSIFYLALRKRDSSSSDAVSNKIAPTTNSRKQSDTPRKKPVEASQHNTNANGTDASLSSGNATPSQTRYPAAVVPVKQDKQSSQDQPSSNTAASATPAVRAELHHEQKQLSDRATTGIKKAERSVTQARAMNPTHHRMHTSYTKKPLANEMAKPRDGDLVEENVVKNIVQKQAFAVVQTPSLPVITPITIAAPTDSLGDLLTIALMAANNKKDSAAGTTKMIAKQSSRLEWGLNLSAGASSLSQGINHLFATTPALDMSAYLSANQNPGTISSSNVSNIKTGLSFTIGVFAYKKIKRTYSLSAGLQYLFASTRLDIGKRIDTAGGAVYHVGNTTNHTNGFHFIDVPVTVEKRFGTASNFSAALGIDLSFLAASNALVFDAQHNNYHTDNNHFNKWQAGLSGAVYYRIPVRQLQLEMGPMINYYPGNIYQKELYGSKHLFIAAFNTHIRFSKKR